MGPRWVVFALVGAVAVSVPRQARAGSGSGSVDCHNSTAFFRTTEGSPGRQYAPDREVQVLHLALDVTPDFATRTIDGSVTFKLKPVLKPVSEVQLDAVDLRVKSVTSNSEVQTYQVTEDKLVVTFAQPLAVDHEYELTVRYSAEPQRGLYFRTPEMGYPASDTHLFSQCEAIEARHWFPCFDSPNRMLTSEVTCRVPEGMTVISNGRLVSRQRDDASNLVAYHWAQEQPHANYLITLAAGYFRKLEDKHGKVPLAFYTPPSEFEQARSSFRDTADMVAFFEEETGVPYPWPKYDQVCVTDFVAGGMENTSATTLTDGTLFSEETENLRNSEGLVAHELVHQWFGDLVTCKDWSHLWLNEGFATYYEALYAGHKHGREALLYEMYERARQITAAPNDTNPIVRRTFGSPDEMFDYLAYPKASWVLHMLRADLGDDLYRRCVKTLLERYRHRNVVTEDFRTIIEELSGRSFDQFFDEWIYHAHHPELQISYAWDEPTKMAKVTVRQTQPLSANVLLFRVPLRFRFKGAFGTNERVVTLSAKEEDFYFPLPAAPEVVRADPNCVLLAKQSFNVPLAMTYAQLRDKEDVVGRLLAIEQLAGRNEKETVAKLKEVLCEDPFYGVRIEASKALRSIHTDEAFDALNRGSSQTDARVRQQVREDLAGFYSEGAYEVARSGLEKEKNPAIVATLVRSLGAYAKPEVHSLLLARLNAPSFRNEVADAAIAAMRLQDDPEYLGPILETLARDESKFTTPGFSQGLAVLGYLGRNEADKTKPREFLLGHLNSRKRAVRIASLEALGELGDPKAIAAVEKLASAGRQNPERDAAESALRRLRAGRRPVDDFKNLREEVLTLQKANRELRQEFEDFKKKVEAREKATAAGAVAAHGKTKVLVQPKSN